MLLHRHIARRRSILGARRSPLLFRYSAGDSIAALGGTFSRTSPATYTDANGVVQTAASGVLRDAHYVNGVRTTLLEQSRTNLLLRSAEFDNASWTATNVTRPANAAVAPDGTSAADQLIETAASGTHFLNQGGSFTSGTAYTSSVYLKKGTLATAPDWVAVSFGSVAFGSAYVHVNLTNGTLAAATNVTPTISVAGSGWYRVAITATATSTVSSSQLVISFTNSSGTGNPLPSYAGSTTSDVYVWGAQSEVGSSVSSYIPTTSATSTRSNDYLYFPLVGNVAETSVYLRHIEQGGLTSNGGSMFHIGTAADGDPKWRVRPTGASAGYTMVTLGAGIAITGPPVFGDSVELIAQILGTFRTQIHQSKNSGTFSSSALGTPTGTAGALGDSWSEGRIAIGTTSGTTGTTTPVLALRDIIVVQGVRDHSYFRGRVTP